jgi:hypothetical protein
MGGPFSKRDFSDLPLLLAAFFFCISGQAGREGVRGARERVCVVGELDLGLSVDADVRCEKRTDSTHIFFVVTAFENRLKIHMKWIWCPLQQLKQMPAPDICYLE